MHVSPHLLHLLSCLTFDPNLDVIMMQYVGFYNAQKNHTCVRTHLKALIIILQALNDQVLQQRTFWPSRHISSSPPASQISLDGLELGPLDLLANT